MSDHDLMIIYTYVLCRDVLLVCIKLAGQYSISTYSKLRIACMPACTVWGEVSLFTGDNKYRVDTWTE